MSKLHVFGFVHVHVFAETICRFTCTHENESKWSSNTGENIREKYLGFLKTLSHFHSLKHAFLQVSISERKE